MSTPTAGTPLAAKDDFLGLRAVCHLATGGEAPVLHTQTEVFARFAMLKSGGWEGRETLLREADEARYLAGRLLGVDGGTIGFPLNVAQAMNMIARSLDLTRDDNVVVVGREFPSVMYPWLRLGRQGVDIRLADPSGRQSAADAVQELADRRTRAIAVSHVCYFTGERRDLRLFREIADRHGSVLVVDASHSAGALVVEAGLADFLVACCYKWLLGVHGAAIAYRNPARQASWRPYEVGWRSAHWEDARERGTALSLVDDGRLFELGNHALLSICLLRNSLLYLLKRPVAEVERYVLGLSGELRRRLEEAGVVVLGPPGKEARSGNVAFEVQDETQWRDGLAERGILSWTGDRRVRLSTHLFNDAGDVSQAAQAASELAELIGQHGRKEHPSRLRRGLTRDGQHQSRKRRDGK